MLTQQRVVLAAPAIAPLVLENAVVVQATFELAGLAGEPLLPAGLAPTIPTLLTFLAIDVADGPLGPLVFAETRLSCRSGVRARALVAASEVQGSPEAIEQLGASWGLGGTRGVVAVERRYDRISVDVAAWGLSVAVRDPAPIGPGDIQYVAGLHPVTTSGGQERLAQVELDIALERAERGRPVLQSYDGLALGERRLAPGRAVVATVGAGAVTLPKVRFLLDPELPPHLGTEVL